MGPAFLNRKYGLEGLDGENPGSNGSDDDNAIRIGQLKDELPYLFKFRLLKVRASLEADVVLTPPVFL